MSHPHWEVELVDELTGLAKPESPDRAILAHLRRGLDAPMDYTLGRVGWLFRRVPDKKLEDAVLAAALFAWVRGEFPDVRDVNFGAAFGLGLTLEEKQRREKRFIDLLDTDKQELSYKLRQNMNLIRSAGVGLDWVLFIKHLGQWENPDRWVQRDWARGFWSAALEEDVEPDVIVSATTSE